MDAHDLAVTVLTIILALSVAIPLVRIVIRLFSRSDRETPEQLDAQAELVGEAGAREQEKKVEAVFKSFRDRENLQ
jgi:hypothetical protein